MQIKAASLSLLLIAVCLTITCRQTGTPPPAPQTSSGVGRERETGAPGGTLRYRATTPVKTFNYLTATDEATLIASFFLLGSRLVDFDHDRGEYVPALAEAWEGDGRRFSVTLREGALFSDGHPITADDVAFTVRAMYDERTASLLFRDLMLIEGRPIEVRVNDARRLDLHFPQFVAVPESYFSNIAVLPRHILESALERGTLRDSYSLTSDPAGVVVSGPFAPQASDPGVGVTLRRNPHYWKKDAAGKPLPYLDAVTIEAIADTNNAVTRLRQNSLDVLDRLRPTDYASLPHGDGPQDGAVRAHDLGPGLNTDHLWFNLNPGTRTSTDPAKLSWFRDVRFRRAVARAIDREAITRTVMGGLATPLYGFVSPGNRRWAAHDLPREEYDPEAARALLREAGYTLKDNTDEPELVDGAGRAVAWTLIVPAENEPRKAMAAIIQEDLAKLGIKMQIAPLEFGELSRRWSQSYEYDAVLLGTVLTEPDPSSYSGMLRSSGANHFWHPKEERPATDWERRIDELVDEVSHGREVNLRQTSFHEVQRLLAEQMPVVPIIARHTIVAASTRLGNYRPSTVAPYSLWNADELFFRQQ